jgi:methionyl-tRNA formyltransferase
VKAPKVVVFAYSDVGHAALKLLIERRVNVVKVFTHADSSTETIWFPSVVTLAKEAGIPVCVDVDLRAERTLDWLTDLAPELILSFYYRELIPAAALELARLGAFNMHGSLLPKYRGRAPVNWAVALGERETGATLHVMTPRADAGDIVDSEPVPIGADDTAADVQARVRDAAVTVLARQLDALLAGTAPRQPQDHSAATKFGRRKPQDGLIEWARSAADLHNLVRAVSHPYPGAFVKLGGDTLKIWRTRRAPDAPATAATPPGRILLEDDRAFAAAGDKRWLELLRAQVNDEPELEGAPLARRLRELNSTHHAAKA